MRSGNALYVGTTTTFLFSLKRPGLEAIFSAVILLSKEKTFKRPTSQNRYQNLD